MTPPPPRVAVGAIVVDDDGRLLVVRRANPPAAGRWTVPGGHVEPGERLRDAVRREVAEETNLQVEVGEMVGVAERISTDHHHVIVDFRATVVAGTISAGDDAAEVAWFGRAALSDAGPTDGLLAFLDDHGIQLAD